MISKIKVEEIIGLRASGFSYAKIAEAVGHSKPAVINICNQHKDEIAERQIQAAEEIREEWSVSEMDEIRSISNALRNARMKFIDVIKSGCYTLPQMMKVVTELSEQLEKRTERLKPLEEREAFKELQAREEMRCEFERRKPFDKITLGTFFNKRRETSKEIMGLFDQMRSLTEVNYNAPLAGIEPKIYDSDSEEETCTPETDEDADSDDVGKQKRRK